jgi:Flp pilus assembly protein TadG
MGRSVRTLHAVRARRGIAATELALLLPVLLLLFAGTIDLARAFRIKAIVTSCAAAGAVYGSSDPTHDSDTAGIQQAAQAEAADLSPLPTVSSTTETDGAYTNVVVTVTYPFQPITGVLGLPNPWSITRTVRMQVAP